MKNNLFIKILIFTVLFSVTRNFAYAQQVNAAIAEFSPQAFPGYPSTGTFTASFGKTSGTVPAGTAQVIFSFVTEVPWSGAAITAPDGWTLAQNSTPTNVRFVLTKDWTDQSDPNPFWIVPVKAIAFRSDQSLSVTSQIQQLDGDWSISAPFTRTSITVSDTPLPVNLTSFDASKEGLQSLLKWTTTKESNSERFDIEHSLNAKNWNWLSSIKSGGQSNVLLSYSFTHEDPSAGENFYRLKMIDNDGTFAYSRIRSIVFGNTEKSLVFPNPASDQLKIDVKDFSELKGIKIYDLNGRTVYNATGSNISKNIDIKSLSQGSYIVELTYNSKRVKTAKIIILR